MICLSCNTILTDKEATRTYEHGEHIDLCDFCFSDCEIDDYNDNYFIEEDYPNEEE